MRLRTLVVSALALAVAAPAHAIPAFARRYNLTCMTCHDPAPKLNSFGEQFLGRGYRLSDDDTTGATTLGDPLLWIQQTMPVAIRMDAYMRAYGGQTVRTDLAVPMVAKLLSGGAIAPSISYYVYLLLAEDGATGPIEDAWLMFRRPLGLPADVTVGQFQIADPVWKRELRLTIENYQILSQTIGDGAANLSYDRGVSVDVAPTASTRLSLQLVNGNGIGEATEGVFDGDAPKAGSAWVMQQVGPLRVGAMGYFGSQRVTLSGTERRNRTWMTGPALQFDRGNLQLNAQYVWRYDSDPTFDNAYPKAKTNGGFAELVWWPQGHGGRLIATGLYNRIESDADAANYETATLNVSFLARRNVRLAGELTWDFLSDHPRAALGFMTAF